MIDINKLVRSNILTLEPYSSARNEFNGNEGVFLDANENPFGELNRYPDPYQKELKVLLSEMKEVSAELSKLESVFGKNGKQTLNKIASLVMDREVTNSECFIEDFPTEFKQRLRLEFNHDDREVVYYGDYRLIIDMDGNVQLESGTTLEMKNMVQVYEILLPLFSKKG